MNQNYPNPFNPVTTIKYAIPNDSNVEIKIYNVKGQLVTTLVYELKQAGCYNVDFDAGTYASGVIFIKSAVVIFLR
ncbi:MAG: T9SS type A sorting domain-containing protein [Melioribacteraceae bacterium]|nr:T9SS type A sorting domain-containing protein [Melioribacteraceae bacterium]